MGIGCENMTKCEYCGKDGKYYIIFKIIGCDLCERCYEITQTRAFQVEISHLLAKGEGDLEHFFRFNNCSVCGTELNDTNWYKSDAKSGRNTCKACKSTRKHENTPKKPICGDVENFHSHKIRHILWESNGNELIC